MTAVAIVARLTHHHVESQKCVSDYWRFECDCGQRLRITRPNLQKPAKCKCGLTHDINFGNAIAKAGPVKEFDSDPWGNALTR